MTPHVTAEAWERRHGPDARLHAQSWPSFDPDLARAEQVTMVVQVNGKVRDRIDVAPDISEPDAIALALASARWPRTWAVPSRRGSWPVRPAWSTSSAEAGARRAGIAAVAPTTPGSRPASPARARGPCGTGRRS